MPQDITILIVTYNSENVLGDCLRALPGGARIIVLDNGSRDGTVAIAAAHEGVEVIRNANIGYGRAANIGLAMTATPYALLLNPDVCISAGAMEAMANVAGTHPGIGIVGPRMVRESGGRKEYREEYVFDAEGVSYVPWVTGACMLLNMEALKQVGYFDENIFLFFEETDLCDRLVDVGYKLAVCQKAEARHKPGTSSALSLHTLKIRAWHSAWSRAYYYRKHRGMPRTVVKSLAKALKNAVNLVKNLALMQKTRVVINAYEIMGIAAFFFGVKAYQPDGTARLT